jgi:ribosomal protein S18 acetylase RimI-like enzyme
MSISIRRVDFLNPGDATAFVAMLDAYARDPMGDGKPLAPHVRATLADRLARRGDALGWLAWRGDEPVGVLSAYVGFSTFAAQPLVNIHDVSVLATARGEGVATALLAAAEKHARAIGCISMTLEVRGDNATAKRVYKRHGFTGADSCQPSDGYLFWKKWL